MLFCKVLSLFESTEVDLNQVENDVQYEEMVGGNEGFSSINPLLQKRAKKNQRMMVVHH
jgi:hypothetical protein